MKEIIFTADDFGIVNEIDKGIIEAIKTGLVKSVAVFANGENSIKKAKQLVNDYPKVELGVHLTICSGSPVLGCNKVPSLCKKNKNEFIGFEDFSDKLDLSQLEAELDAQIKLLKNNIPIYHLSSHYNLVTLLPKYYKVFLGLAKKHNLKVRPPKVLPTFRQNIFLLNMRAKVIEDVSPIVAANIEGFGRLIDRYFKKHANGVKSPDYADTSHYGPIASSKIKSKAELNKKVKKKINKLERRLKTFQRSKYQSAEFILHLHEDKLKSHDEYEKEIPGYYHGIDSRYFDSRVVELHSIKSFTEDILKTYKIKLGSWK